MRAASRDALERLLGEDCPFGDLTTEALAVGAKPGRMTFSARDAMTLALVEDAAALLELAGASVELHAASGEAAARRTHPLRAGAAEALLRGWKVAQTLIEIWSGVASAAHDIVVAARRASPDVVVACTRKTTPGTKIFAIAAIKAGGAVAHRLGLSETILVFPEHLAFTGGEHLSDIVARLRRAAPSKRRW